jgi:hypothetical protein
MYPVGVQPITSHLKDGIIQQSTRYHWRAELKQFRWKTAAIDITQPTGDLQLPNCSGWNTKLL